MKQQTATATAPDLYTDSPEHSNPIFTELYNLVRPRLTDYITDLIKHDRSSLESHRTAPFIYGHRATGTGITILLPDLESYESAGLRVGEKYLFGYIQDERQKIEILYNLSTGVTYAGCENKYFYYYDGKKLRASTREKCEMIHHAHIDKILRDAASKKAARAAA